MVDTIAVPHLLDYQYTHPPAKMLNQTSHGIPISTKLPAYINIRAATLDDLLGITECFFTSFWPSHPFWTVKWPPRLFRPWMYDTFRIGLEDDASMRTFVAIDTRVTDPFAKNTPDGRVAGFTRWRVPQADGNRGEMWPAMPEGVDMSCLGPFFAGMAENRAQLMKSKPHWFLQFLGTEVEYQRMGIGEAFVSWGCELADKEDLNVYIDASSVGGPFYQKHFGAVPVRVIEIPEQKAYGKLEYFSHVRPRLSEQTNQINGLQ